MIQDLLDYSQMRNGKFRKNISKFNIIKTIEQVMAIQRMQAKQKKLQFTCKFINIEEPNQIGSNKHSALIETDEQRLMQVILCLQSNAIKFTQKGSVTIKAEIV